MQTKFLYYHNILKLFGEFYYYYIFCFAVNSPPPDSLFHFNPFLTGDICRLNGHVIMADFLLEQHSSSFSE